MEGMIAREVLLVDTDTNTKMLVEDYMHNEAYMMCSLYQSYITRCLAMVVTPRATLENLVMAVNTN